MSEAKSGGDLESPCPVCWSLLCEPVAWPECAHHFCLVCALQTRRRPKPVCPLCRAPASQVRQAAELQVSHLKASAVRKVVGYSAYQAQRRETWAQVVELDAAGGLGGPLALLAGRSEVWQRLRLGSQQEVLMEAKDEELLRWSRRSKGGCFAVVLQPADIEVGAKGRVCRIVDWDPPSDRRVLVEGGAACRVLELNVGQDSPDDEGASTSNFLVGKLEELDEDELPARGNDLGSLAAAADIVHILGVLGRNLQAVRQRWMMTALVSLLDEDTRALENSQEQDRQGLESMLGVMMSYRQIIHQMDALLSQASATADRLMPPTTNRSTSGQPTSDPEMTWNMLEEAADVGETIASLPPSTSERQRSANLQTETSGPNEVPQVSESRQGAVRMTRREPAPVSQVEALQRRGHVLPVAGATTVASRTASSLSSVRRRNAPTRESRRSHQGT